MEAGRAGEGLVDLACHPGQLPGHSLADLLVQHSQEAHCGRESRCIRRIRTRTCDLLGMGAHTSADGTTWLAPGPERSTWASMVGWHSMERVHLEWRHLGSIVGAVPPTDTRRSCGALQILGMPNANRNVPVPTWPWKAPEVSPPPGGRGHSGPRSVSAPTGWVVSPVRRPSRSNFSRRLGWERSDDLIGRRILCAQRPGQLYNLQPGASRARRVVVRVGGGSAR